MAKTLTPKVRIDTSYTGKKKTERFEFRCSKNFQMVVDALIDKYAKEYKGKSKADLMVYAIKELAQKENLLLVGDDYYL